MSEPKRTRLVFLGFAVEEIASTVLGVIEGGIRAKTITVEDWALVHKAPGGKLTIKTDKSKDPGGARGALFGGGAGYLLAALSGPIGAGAVAAGAAIGAVTAAVRDSGLKNDDIVEVSKFMADGRTGIMVAMPLDAVDAVGRVRRRRTTSSRPRIASTRSTSSRAATSSGRSRSTASAERAHRSAAVSAVEPGKRAPPCWRRWTRVTSARGAADRGRGGGDWSATGSRRRAGRSSRATCGSAATSWTSRRGPGPAAGRSSWSRCGAAAAATSGSPRRRSTTASGPRCGARSARCSSAATLPDGAPLPHLPLRVDLVALDVGRRRPTVAPPPPRRSA